MKGPFEPMASCSLALLSWKVVFCISFTSMREVSELLELQVGFPYLMFFFLEKGFLEKGSFIPVY